MVVDLFVQLGLDRIEQVLVNDGRLLASEGLTLEDHFADVKPVAKDVGKGPGTEADDGHTREGKPLMNPNVAIELGYAIDSPDRLEF